MTSDNQASPDDVAAAFARDGYYYTSQPLRFPPPTQNMRRHSCPSQDDFIHKGRGLLLAFVGCAVFWMLVFLMIGGV